MGYHGENIHIFLPEMKKYFNEIIHSKDFEKSRGYVPMLEIFNLIMNMTNRLDVKVRQTKSLCLALKLLHTNDTNYTTPLTHTCN